jgi:peptide/nickel transport system ATP-binding protein
MMANPKPPPNPGETLLSIENLVVEHQIGRHRVHAVSDVSFDVRRGETLGLVGESGCGKSSLGRAILQLPPPTAGRVRFDGVDLTRETGEALRRLRRRLQLVFQDPVSSLNPRRRVGDIVAEPLIIDGVADPSVRQRRVAEVLRAVGLDPELVMHRRPHEFSGGQCQRIAIARALVGEPDLVICDEAVSALDVSVRAQILNLLEEMKARYGITLIFIAHDLAVVKAVSDRVAVMYLGKLCEPLHVILRRRRHEGISGFVRDQKDRHRCGRSAICAAAAASSGAVYSFRSFCFCALLLRHPQAPSSPTLFSSIWSGCNPPRHG